MRTYVITTGAIFGLLAVAHGWRMFAERGSLATDPWFLLITLAAAMLCFWAVVIVRRSSSPGPSTD
jgi:hypothetical protein